MSPKKKAPKSKERITELEKALTESEKKSEKLLSQLKYAKADLENIQKQNQRRIGDIMDRANGRLLEQLVPLMDELTLLAAFENCNDEKISEAIGMIRNKLVKIMETEGVRPIEALGYPFDPFKHEAMMEVKTEEEPDGYVLEEIRKGYMYKERVLRASMVKVARTPIKEEEETDNE
jgi:molecular chaperone GrpE